MKLRVAGIYRLAWIVVLLAIVFVWSETRPASVAQAQQPAMSPETQQPEGSASKTQQEPAQQAPAQQAPSTQAPAAGGPILKSESRLVRVDVIVTNKKGEYITDLTAKDFRVFEDNKSQAVSTFSFGTDPAAPPGAQRHYMVLLFDDSTMDQPTQVVARDAAAKFIDANAGPDRVMAVMDFGGTMRMSGSTTSR